MGRSNLEIAREIFAAWGRGDYSESHWFDHDLRWRQGEIGIEGQGLASLGRFWGDTLSSYEHLRSEPEEILEVDEQRVLGLLRYSGRGRESAVPLRDLRGAALLRLRGERVVEVTLWSNQEPALEEFGIKR